MADKVTLSMHPETLALARVRAEREGVTLSAWMERAARRAALASAGREYEEWLTAHPNIREEVSAWRQMGARLNADRMAAWPSV